MSTIRINPEAKAFLCKKSRKNDCVVIFHGKFEVKMLNSAWTEGNTSLSLRDLEHG